MHSYSVLLGILLLAASAAPAAADVCDKVDRKADGAVVIEPSKDENGLDGVRACIYVDATTAQVWATLVDYPSFPKWMDKVEKIAVKWTDGRTALVDYQVGTMFGSWKYQLKRVHDPNRIHWERTHGDMKVVKGIYELRPLPEGSLLTIETYADPGVSVPSFILNYFKDKGTRKLLEDIRSETRKRTKK